MKDESISFLKRFLPKNDELKKYGKQMANLCDYLPISLSFAGRTWSCIDNQFYKDIQEFVEYLETPRVFTAIQSTKDFVLEDRISKHINLNK